MKSLAFTASALGVIALVFAILRDRDYGDLRSSGPKPLSTEGSRPAAGRPVEKDVPPDVAANVQVDLGEPVPAGDEASPMVGEDVATAKASVGRTSLQEAGRLSFAELEKRIYALPLTLDEEEQGQVLALLPTISSWTHLDAHQRHRLAELLFKRLRLQENGAPELGGALIRLLEDQEQEQTIREYALQHLSQWYEPRETDPLVEGVLWHLVESPQERLAGTAVLAIQRLSRAGRAIANDRLEAAALSLLTDETVTDATQAAAIGVCAEIGSPRALESIRRAVSDESRPLSQLAAVAALGGLGTAEDHRLLAELSRKNADIRQNAAQVAGQRIKAREFQP
jgi:hypothetical protein